MMNWFLPKRIFSPLLSLRCSSLFSQQGAALLTVLVFGVVGFIAVTAYLMAARMHIRQTGVEVRNLQSLLTARSGVWWLLSQMKSKSGTDTLKTINTLDRKFNADLFKKPDSGITTGSELPSLGSKPREINPFSTGMGGSAAVSYEASAVFGIVRSIGSFREAKRTVSAIIGGQPVRPSDTLLYLPSPMIEIKGRCPSQRQPGHFRGVREETNQALFSQITSYYTNSMQQDSATTIMDLPRIVRTIEEMNNLPPVVNGPLLIEARVGRFNWKSNRTIRIYGDLQISGDPILENATFCVAGEIKLYDEAQLKNVTLVSLSRLFIGDRARFSGNALIMSTITVYGKASVTDKSTLVALGKVPKKEDSGKAPLKGGLVFSVILAEECQVDGVVAAIQNASAIKTDPNVKIKGILIASQLCHNGSLQGIAKVGVLLDCSNPEKPEYNTVNGSFAKLNSIDQYRIPIFLGKPAVLSWREE